MEIFQLLKTYFIGIPDCFSLIIYNMRIKRSLLICLWLIFPLLIAAESWSSLGAVFSYQFQYYDLEAYTESREFLDAGLEYKGYWGDEWGIWGRMALYYPLYFIRTNSLGYQQGSELRELKSFFCTDLSVGLAKQWDQKGYDIEWGIGVAYKLRQTKQSFQLVEDYLLGLSTELSLRLIPFQKSKMFIYSTLNGSYFPLIWSRELDFSQRLFTGQATFSVGIGWDS